VGSKSRLIRHPIPRLASVLFQQAHVGDDHAAVRRFAHVINGEQADLDSAADCRLHARFDAGFGETRPYFSNQLQEQNETLGPNSFG